MVAEPSAHAAPSRPTAAECEAVVRALTNLHGRPRRPARPPAPPRGRATGSAAAVAASCGQVPTVLDALIRTILSQNTTNRNSGRAMAGFSARFNDDLDAARRAPVATIAESIACGGLANVKAQRIRDILRAVHSRHGTTSLEHLREADTATVMAELTAFPGVGPKTAGCVLLFCLARDVFAVDTHIFRITGRLGWLPPRATRVSAQAHLDARVPDPLKYDLHVLLVRHGQTCPRCAAHGRPQRPPAGPCPLRLVA